MTEKTTPASRWQAELLSLEDVRVITGLAASTIQKGASEGWFPPGRKIGLRCVRWLRSEVDAWIDGLPKVRYSAGGDQMAA